MFWDVLKTVRRVLFSAAVYRYQEARKLECPNRPKFEALQERPTIASSRVSISLCHSTQVSLIIHSVEWHLYIPLLTQLSLQDPGWPSSQPR